MTRTPPLLLGATLLFWGWQSGLLWVGAIMALVLEAGRVSKARWEFSNEDFQRIWTFCTLLVLVSLVYAFTANEGPSDFRGFFQNPNFNTQRDAGTASARTAASVIRWLPMLFFLFVAAQVYSTREAIPLETISLILRRRWRKARKEGRPAPPSQNVNVSYPYFALTLLASSIHTGEDLWFFWGLCVLIPWALWPLRPNRYGAPVWAAVMLTCIAVGYVGQRGISEVARYLEGVNSQFFARFARGRFDAGHTRMDLGHIGRLKASTKIVMRVELPPGNPAAPLLREASYRTIKGNVWLGESLRSTYESVQAESDQTTWVLVPGKSNLFSVKIACSLEGRMAGANAGLLPLPSGSGKLVQLQAYLLSKNNLGAVLAQGPGLIIFNAQYGPGATIDSPPVSADAEIPEREVDALRKVIADLQLRDKTPQQVRRALEQFFSTEFSYSLYQGREGREERSRTNDTALTRFLLRTRSGHCEYFATATVLLLRELGIPARYAVGYAVHESSGGRKYVVRQRDAHAWCLMWNEQRGTWENLDTTPGSWVEAEQQRPTQLLWLSDLWSRIKFEVARVRWGQTRLRQYLLWTAVPVLVLLLAQIVFRRRRSRRKEDKARELERIWPGLDSEFYELAERLEHRGMVRHPGESLSDWLGRVQADPRLGPLHDPLRQLLRLHYRYRFDPVGLSPDERTRLRLDTRACLLKLSA